MNTTTLAAFNDQTRAVQSAAKVNGQPKPCRVFVQAVGSQFEIRPIDDGLSARDWKSLQKIVIEASPERVFTTAHIEALRTEYAKLTAIDPCQPSYDKLIKLLNAQSQTVLRQLAGAGIKFVSLLARNRVK